ncbi:hypothetical protein OG317_14125 [Streptomyces sp. NBC_01167]|uniref:hypothetical protein n=1 Tax=Streptomyces sp. NBC_01167 TaxID=2903756 RepID=UPI00386C6ED2|nr:hypothetical protein OG317_14125 [Streptomyces sp. NBC_01167]
MRLRNVLAAGAAAATVVPAALAAPAAATADPAARAAVSETAANQATPSNATANNDTASKATASKATASKATASKATGSKATANKAAVGVTAVRAPGDEPTCGAVAAKSFPIDSRIHGGPPVHHPGGGFEQWSVDLANTTAEPCRNIHPVIVFAARDRGLTPPRVTLEFYDEDASRWRPASLETTAEDEVVGVLDDGAFAGFAVPARATLTVRVRFALTADTPPNQVTVNAAVVQRRGDDGDWVGESGDYRFAVMDDDGSGLSVTRDELATTGTGALARLGMALGTIVLGSAVVVLASRKLRTGRR